MSRFAAKRRKLSENGSSSTPILLTCARASKRPKSWLSVETSSDAVNFSDSGVKLTISAYKMLRCQKGARVD